MGPLVLLAAIPFVGAMGAGACSLLHAPAYDGPDRPGGPGAPVVDGRFANLDPIESKGPWTMLRWRLTRDPPPWPAWVENGTYAPPPERVGPGEVRATFVNHATVLVQIDGVNLLTDPIWSERASPVGFAGPKRVHAPGIAFEDLPPIDAVLVSHDHFDSLDLPTLVRLQDLHRPRVYVGLGTREILRAERIEDVVEMDWWQRAELAPGVTVTAVPARHWSGRSLTDRFRRLWMGFVVEGPAGRVYFAGDTGWGRHFAEIGARFGPMRLALLPIGAYEPRWFMKAAHISPAEAVGAFEAVGAASALAIHWGTFELSDEGRETPVRDLRAALDAAGIDQSRFWALAPGEGRVAPPLEDRPRVARSPEADGGARSRNQ